MIVSLPEGLAFTMVEAALRGCLLVLAAGAALLFFRKRSAALDCAVWGGVLAASLAMPAIQALAPPLFLRAAAPVAESPAMSFAAAPVIMASEPVLFAPVSEPFDWLTLLYGFGLAAGLARLALGFAEGAALRRRSRPARLTAPFEVRESDAVSVPMTFGWPRAFVILPATWPFWDEHKLNAVLLHEGAHIKRGDFLLNALANLNVALFWFSPHSWWLKRRLIDASEQASDDRALSSFGDGALYADVLLSFAGRKRAPTMALPMARGALSARIERALDGERKLSAALGLKTGLLLGAALSAAAYFAAGVSLAEAPQKPPRIVDAPSVTPRPSAPKAAPKPAPAPEPAESPSTLEAPEPPETPDAPATNDWDAVDAALAGESREDAKARAAEWASDAAQDAADAAHDPHKRYSSQNHWITRQSHGGDNPYSYLSIRDDGIEFAKEGKHYRITDREICDKAHEAYEAVHELAGEQGEIGEEQARLGEKMSMIGERQSELRVDAGRLRETLRKRMAEIEALASKSRLTQEELGEIQSQLGELQGELGELQGLAAVRSESYGEGQEELAAEMAELGRRQAALGRMQEEASRKAEMKLRRLIEQAMAEGRVERVH